MMEYSVIQVSSLAKIKFCNCDISSVFREWFV